MCFEQRIKTCFSLVCPSMATSTKNTCIIHSKAEATDAHENLISPKTYDSWLTILEAAKVRNFLPVLEIAENLNENEVPAIFYHRKCRIIFSMKRDLESLKCKAKEPDDKNNEEFKPITAKKRNITSNSRVYINDCIFCGKDKYIRASSSWEPLVKATQLRVDKTLREKDLAKCDDKILAAITRDILAAEAHYHRSCCRDYTRPEKIRSSASSDQEKDDAGERAISDLFTYIRSEVIEKQSITTMTELTKKLEMFAQARGKEKLNDGTRKHIRRKLEAEFGSILLIFPDDKGKLIVVLNSLSVEKVVKTNMNVRKELDTLRSHSFDIYP